LWQRRLNGWGASKGAIGSHALALMVLSFLQQRAVVNEPVQHPGLGALFVEFLQLYGVHFNPRAVQISATKDHRLTYAQKDLTDVDQEHMNRFILQDPVSGKDVMGDVEYHWVTRVFEHSYRILHLAPQVRPTVGGAEKHIEHPCLFNRPTLLTRVLHSHETPPEQVQLQTAGQALLDDGQTGIGDLEYHALPFRRKWDTAAERSVHSDKVHEQGKEKNKKNKKRNNRAVDAPVKKAKKTKRTKIN